MNNFLKYFSIILFLAFFQNKVDAQAVLVQVNNSVNPTATSSNENNTNGSSQTMTPVENDINPVNLQESATEQPVIDTTQLETIILPEFYPEWMEKKPE